jgi:UDP-N-acetyl-D-mannosaminuronate dehydrogenase
MPFRPFAKMKCKPLIIISLGLGYLGFKTMTESSNSVKVLGVNIEASNETEKRKGYMFIGLAIVLFAGGIYTINKSK